MPFTAFPTSQTGFKAGSLGSGMPGRVGVAEGGLVVLGAGDVVLGGGGEVVLGAGGAELVGVTTTGIRLSVLPGTAVMPLV